MDWVYMIASLVREMNANRLRRMLSILGVIIGTGAVVASLGVVEGGREQLRSYLDRLGANVVFLEDRFDYELPAGTAMTEGKDVAARDEDAMDMPVAGDEIKGHETGKPVKQETQSGSFAILPSEWDPLQPSRQLDALTLEDIDYLKRRFPGALHVEPQMLHWLDVGRVGEKPFSAMVEGGTPRGGRIRNLDLREGRYLCAQDVDNAERVCVLGDKAARELFGDGSAVGQTVSILGARWQVIGVLEKKGSLMRFDYDELVMVPITALHERAGIRLINAVLIQATDAETALAMQRDLLDVVLWRLHDREADDFQIFCQDELMQQKEQTLQTFRILTVAIAAFSLLVSGIGIMNIMLVSVRERTREIGIWKAVGADDHNVLWYFLAESVLTCLVGGILGVVLGVVLGAQATGFIAGTVTEVRGWMPVYRAGYIVLALGTAVVVGLLSGLFPAIVAARMEPVEALRYE